MSKGMEMIFRCIDCGHEQLGYSAQDGYSCDECGGVLTPICLADEALERANALRKKESLKAALCQDKLYYISHPYTTYGDPAANRYSAAIFEKCINDMYKIKTINPIVIIPVGIADPIAMEMCSKMYSICDAVILCPNWEKSKGCNEEYQWALRDNKPIYILHQDLTITKLRRAS